MKISGNQVNSEIPFINKLKKKKYQISKPTQAPESYPLNWTSKLTLRISTPHKHLWRLLQRAPSNSSCSDI
ncbi:hypothetical protein ERO13_D02G109433v2 [Gossypium hirsutum]|nr:hypothetical protein ERO13_D02G109433v2 [Gossypium hirsutum]